jgi:hypothetical protein
VKEDSRIAANAEPDGGNCPHRDTGKSKNDRGRADCSRNMKRAHE